MIAAVLGWAGTVGTFAAYILVSRGRLGISSLRYAFINTVGGVFGGTAAVLYGAWPSAAANLAWALVGGHMLWIGSRRVLTRTRAQAQMHVSSLGDHSGIDPDAYIEERATNTAVLQSQHQSQFAQLDPLAKACA